MIPTNFVWAGDESSLDMYLSLLKRVQTGELTPPEVKAMQGDDEEDNNPVGLDVVGNVGVMTISGGTVTSSNWLTRLFGIVSYGDIKERFYQAGEDPNIKGVLMRVETSGGMAEGVGGLSTFISNFNNKVKPVVAHTETKAFSAGYWYGTAGQRTVMGEDARVGSVGAILVHTEYTEAMKQNGIKATVFRSAPYKALGTPYEKLDEKATAELTREVNFWHSKFVKGIAGNLGLDEEKVKNTIANGKTYSAEEAPALGMVHSVLSFEETVGKLNAALENKPAGTNA